MTTKKSDLSAVYALLAEVDREFTTSRRRLAKLAREAIPTGTKPTPTSGAPTASPRIVPTRKPSSWTDEGGADPHVGPIRKATLAALALSLSERFCRPLDDITATLKRLIELDMDRGATFDEALSSAHQEVADGIRRGMR